MTPQEILQAHLKEQGFEDDGHGTYENRPAFLWITPYPNHITIELGFNNPSNTLDWLLVKRTYSYADPQLFDALEKAITNAQEYNMRN